MKYVRYGGNLPVSAAVIHDWPMMEAVRTGIPPGGSTPVSGGAGVEMREIFRQYDELLYTAGVDRIAVVSVRLYLQNVVRDIAEVNAIYREYFGSHPPNRRAYGVDLQSGMLVEAAIVAELPQMSVIGDIKAR